MNRAGFALPVSLWLVVAVVAATVEGALLSRSIRAGVLASVELTGARAAADAGIEHVRSRLDGASRGDDPFRLLGTLPVDTIPLGEARYRIAVEQPGARLHLNAAGEGRVRRLLQAVGIDAGEADRIAQALADWQDADDLHRPRGAERSHYIEAGAAFLPRNGPLQTVEELALVRGITPEHMERLRPLVTVDGSGLINVNEAPAPVLASLPGFTPPVISAVLGARGAGRHLSSLQQIMDLVPSAARGELVRETEALLRVLVFETHEIVAEAEGWIEGSPLRARARAILAWGDGPVSVREWRVGP